MDPLLPRDFLNFLEREWMSLLRNARAWRAARDRLSDAEMAAAATTAIEGLEAAIRCLNAACGRMRERVVYELDAREEAADDEA